MSSFVNNVGFALKDSYTAKLMSPQLRFAGVYLMQPKYTVLSQLTNLLSEGKPVDNRKVERSKLGNIGVSVEIGTRTANGVNLDLVFNDPAFQQARERDLIRSTTGAIARVISASPGQITIAPWTDSTGANATTFATADFAAATKLSVIGDSSANSDSTGKQSLTYTPDYDFNYSSVKRDAVNITRDDLMQRTYELADDKFWAFHQENMMRTRFAKNYEQLLHTSPRNQKNGVTTTGGFDWTIRNFGNYNPVSSTSWSQSDLHDFLETMITQSGANMGEIAVLGGARWLRNFQEVIGDKYIQYVGQSNTVGGAEVKGINISEYTFLGTTIKTMHYALYDDAEYWGNDRSDATGVLKKSSSAMFLNTSQVETTQGMLPAFEKFYYDTQPMRYYYLRGIIGVNDADPSQALKDGDYVLSSNDRDGFTAGILCDDGIFINGPERHGLWEQVS